MLASYPSIYPLGHRALRHFFADQAPVVIQEKVDGSQFSFGQTGDGFECRSKGAQLHPPVTDKLFRPAVETAYALFTQGRLRPGWVYRGETLCRPKHNTLAYDRVPSGHIVLFDIMAGDQEYLSHDDMAFEALRLGLEAVPALWRGPADAIDADLLRALLLNTSRLGGCQVEGVVMKRQPGHELWGPDHKPLVAKHVSESFKEVHRGAWRKAQPTPADIRQAIADQYRTPARWQKAAQHLAEAGTLTDTPADIGPLMNEVQADVLRECEADIKDALWAWAKRDVLRGTVRGLPEWYRQRLLDAAFETERAS